MYTLPKLVLVSHTRYYGVKTRIVRINSKNHLLLTNPINHDTLAEMVFLPVSSLVANSIAHAAVADRLHFEYPLHQQHLEPGAAGAIDER